MRYQNHAGVAEQALQFKPQVFAGEHIKRAEGLVEHQQARLVDQRPAQTGALLHAARQFVRVALLIAFEPDKCQQLQSFFLVHGAPGAQLAKVRLDHFKRKHDVVQNRSPRQHDGGLKGHTRFKVWPPHFLARRNDVAFSSWPKPCDKPHQRGLAATRWAINRHKLTRLDSQAAALQREPVALQPVAHGHVVYFNKIYVAHTQEYAQRYPTQQHQFIDRTAHKLCAVTWLISGSSVAGVDHCQLAQCLLKQAGK